MIAILESRSPPKAQDQAFLFNSPLGVQFLFIAPWGFRGFGVFGVGISEKTQKKHSS